MSAQGRLLGSLDTVQRVERGALRAIRLELWARSMRKVCRPSQRPDLSDYGKLEIARALLKLQRLGRLRLWVDWDVVYISPFTQAATETERKRIPWEKAAVIADNPDRYLAEVLR